MNTLTRSLFVASLAAVLALSGTPSHAAETFKIIAGGTAPYSPIKMGFKPSGCNTALVSSPLNGLDAKIVSAAPYAGKTVMVSWTATVDWAASTGVAYLFAGWDSRCNEVGFEGVPAGTRAWKVAVPAGLKWMVVQTTVSADLTVTITPI